MRRLPRVRDLDAGVWRAATWAAPFTIQLVLGVAIGTSWLLGRHVSDMHGLAQYVGGLFATLLLSAAANIFLIGTGSPRAQGVAISIVGSWVVAAVGGIAYGFWIITW